MPNDLVSEGNKIFMRIAWERHEKEMANTVRKPPKPTPPPISKKPIPPIQMEFDLGL